MNFIIIIILIFSPISKVEREFKNFCSTILTQMEKVYKKIGNSMLGDNQNKNVNEQIHNSNFIRNHFNEITQNNSSIDNGENKDINLKQNKKEIKIEKQSHNENKIKNNHLIKDKKKINNINNKSNNNKPNNNKSNNNQYNNKIKNNKNNNNKDNNNQDNNKIKNNKNNNNKYNNKQNKKSIINKVNENDRINTNINQLILKAPKNIYIIKKRKIKKVKTFKKK